MTTFLVDDQISTNGKALDMFNRGGADAFALWALVGTSCSGHNNEGIVTPAVVASMARMLKMSDDEREAAVVAIVESRMWHDAKAFKKCDACKDRLAGFQVTMPRDGWCYHDWNDQNWSRLVAKDPVERQRHNRNKKLSRSPDIVRAIRARDGEWCRYCRIQVDFNARRGPTRGTYDHIDPNILDGPDFVLANDPENVVVACNRCNSEKKDRTPMQADMTLLPPGPHLVEVGS